MFDVDEFDRELLLAGAAPGDGMPDTKHCLCESGKERAATGRVTESDLSFVGTCLDEVAIEQHGAGRAKFVDEDDDGFWGAELLWGEAVEQLMAEFMGLTD